ncbi:fimbria/pilus outer membrane usher protein [Paraburkholderia solisilvae]|uniref:Outer membrane usher protein HtrE n=1 Tax=Paraburkholderia solisilvae TaxID=624376 RepID=A0A6J5DH40_9BURK|nr:fimbria/pilus outer membrane usher protein [Paraburkholderia solisilvae]CAB3753560.1 Outer membrane usher protein HtrE [Paraburkholderia solisilvae]
MRHPTPKHLRLRPCCAVALSLCAATCADASAPAGDVQVGVVQFNDQFFQRPGAPKVDVSRFEKGNPSLPGTYRVDLYVNQTWTGRVQVTLRQIGADPANVAPCFDRELLEQVGVDLGKLSAQATASLTAQQADANACLIFADLVDGGHAHFDNGEQRLDVELPQAAMLRQVRGYVDPRYWDDGVPAAMLQYNANVYRFDSGNLASTRGYIGLLGGANVGAWRLRHNGNLTTDTVGGTHYQSVQTSLERAIVPLKSRLTIGDAFTDGALFDSVGFRGVRLATDDQMYPESQRGYAPVVRGIANSNAQVQIRQNGNIIYTGNVPAGPFEISDLYPTGYGGDLEVIVTEADGSVHVSRVPYASAVNAVRAGITRFGVTAGEYRDPTVPDKPLLVQGTVQHGFSNLVTGYAGVTLARGYLAAVTGMALNTRFGAFGFDITQADTRLANGQSRNGQSVRIAYSKLIDPTGTNVSVAAYRYSSSGYLGLQDAMQLRSLQERGQGDSLMSGIPRGLLQITINQNLPAGFGSFYLTGSSQDYWDRGRRDTQFQAGYTNNLRRINYSISLSRQLDLTLGRWDNRVMLTVGIPLGFGSHAPYLSSSVQRDSRDTTDAQASLTGALGVDNAATYGVNVGYDAAGGTSAATNVGGNATYVAPVATLTGSASKGTGYTQYGAGMSGGVVAYGGGVAFAPSMGDTVAIVEAKGASGARITNSSGLRVDPWGHAIVSNLQPFENNEIDIDPKGLPMSVELKSSTERVAPTQGAIVRLTFETEGGGRSVLMRASFADGRPLPFGAQVSDASGASVGTVAQAGRIVLRGLRTDSGELRVKWGDAADQQCRLPYALPPAAGGKTNWTAVDAACSTN